MVGSKLHVRPMELGDVDRFVSYWHDGEADLGFLGIDRTKLGDREASRARYVAMCGYGHPAPAVGFSILLDDRLVGFTNVNLRGRAGYLHIHLVDAAARGHGIVSAILLAALPVLGSRVMADYNLDELVLETRSRNENINRVVQRLPLPAEGPIHLADPDGLAGPGEFYVRRLPRSMFDQRAD